MGVKLRITMTIIFTVGCLLIWWISGFNFDTRGTNAAICFMTTGASAALGYTFPFFND